MKITSYSEQVHNKERFNVDVDDKFLFAISINGWIKNNLYVGKEITQEEIDKILLEDNKQVALDKVLSILEHGMKTEKEIIRKLRETKDSCGREKKIIFSEDDIDYAIQKAKEYGYINDEYYVKCYIKERAIPNKWGEQKIYGMLLQKGIEKEIIKNGIEKYLEEDTLEDGAYQLALKKYNSIDKNKYDDRVCTQKVVTFLMGKGYSYDLIKKIMEKVVNCEEY